jgi:hypothetical protein
MQEQVWIHRQAPKTGLSPLDISTASSLVGYIKKFARIKIRIN